MSYAREQPEKGARWNRINPLAKAVRASAVALISYMLITNLIVAALFSIFFGRNDPSPDSIEPTYADVDHGRYPRDEIRFPSCNNVLVGYLYHPTTDAPKGLAIFAHGISSNADTMLPLVMPFVDDGWACLAFNGTGTNRSEGTGRVGLCQTSIDLDAVLDYVHDDAALAKLPVALVGHSMGGYAAAVAAPDDASVVARVCICAFDSPLETMCYQVEATAGPIGIILRPALWMQSMLLFWERTNVSASECINAHPNSYLVAYATDDEVVPPRVIGIPTHTPNVRYKAIEVGDGPRNTHTTVWLSDEAAALSIEMWGLVDQLHKEYGNPLPAGVREDLFGMVAPDKLLSPDPEFAEELTSFCDKAAE